MGADRRVPALGPLLTIRRRAVRLLAATLAAGAASTPGWAGAPGLAGGARWSAPAGLSSCSAEGAPRVLFPSEGPGLASGPGAVVWAAAPGCATGAGARVDLIAADGTPGAPLRPRSPARRLLAPLAPLQAAAAPAGQIAIAGTDRRGGSRAVLVEGPAGGPFTMLAGSAGAGAPTALGTAYLGDLAILAETGRAPSAGLSLELQRHYARRATDRALGSGPATGETVALDYRSDALAVWERHGSLYACYVPASGRPKRPQRLGPAGAELRVQALVSDDQRAIVLWSSGTGARTRVYLSQSAPGVRFGLPELLEDHSDPNGMPAPTGSPQLIRLSSESVLAAWAGVAGGRWVVRAAPIDQHGLRSISTIAAAAGDALLSALAPGPRGEAVLLWSQPALSASGSPEMSRQSLLASRGVEAAPGVARFAAPEAVAPPGPVSDATLGIDPASDLALATWLGEGGSIRWSARPSMPGV